MTGNRGHFSRWTTALDLQLTCLWNDGVSGAGIAELMGLPSRSTALGRIHRLGLMRAPRSLKPLKPYPKNRKSAAKKPRQAKPVIMKVEQTPPQYRVLLDLKPRQCRWAMDTRNGEHLFCAAATEIGDSWCPMHRKRAFHEHKKWEKAA